MRKYQKKELLSIMDLLESTVSKIKQIINMGNADILREVLEDCQNAVIEAGTEIENSEGEGTGTVALLEDLCETIYQCSVARNRQAALKLCGEIRRQLLRVRDSIRNDLPESRVKAVFLPYKAAMWDSLESVWRAAAADVQCDAYVVPIPYYDKNPDGSFGKLHDEKEEYPDYVPVTDWRTYNLEAEHPDIIFIHNPYDYCNIVTSVHPDFYSERLKQCTDMLVYIPYFVCNGNVREHYCTTPGVYNADRVILQSDKICDTYKRVFVTSIMEQQKNMGSGEKARYRTELEAMAKEKFLALGSPKFDKAADCGNRTYEIPKEWKELIGEGASRKKVILLNIHISSIMPGNEDGFFKDIERVLTTFKNNRDTVLLWRPHPLMEATINSMNPGVRDRYYKLVAAYREEGWGIYDDTPDFDRAVDIADAYYGDRSSVAELFRYTGKPVMLMNHNINS